VPKGAATRTSPRKPKLGQHFLTNEAAALRIVEALGDVSEATVLEIGPGRGAITDLLAGKARRLIAVELDRVLSAQLRMKFNMQHNVEIIEGDILKIELDTVFVRSREAFVPDSISRPSRLGSSATCRITLPPTSCCGCWSITATFDDCHHGAERSCRSPGGFGGKPRLWLVFGHGAVVRSGRATLHASAGSVYSSP